MKRLHTIAAIAAVAVLLPAVVFAIDASSTSFFVRQDVGQIFGTSSSTSFKFLNGGTQSSLGVSTSTSFGVRSGSLFSITKDVKPVYTQNYFHWRNDDGNETGATSATGGAQGTALSGLAKNTPKRLRIEIANTGGTKYSYSTQQFRIEYALLSGTCAGSSYTDVGAAGGDWDMASTSQLTEAGNTTNISTAIGGVTDGNASFLVSNGGQRESTSQTAALSLPSDSFIELEYAVTALSAATNSGTYCFRVTNAGSTSNFNYSVYPTAIIAAGGNATPAVSAVSVNGGSAINLTPNATTTVNVSFTVTDTDGCSDVFTNGGVTTTLYRSGVGSACSADNRNCYIVSTTTNNCSGGSSAQATATYQVYYFAQATDASSSYPTESWWASVLARDAASATGTATSSQELNTVLAIDVTPTTTNYGSIAAGVNSGSTNQTTTVRNVGNASTTLQISGTALTSGANSIATSSQHYATSSFTFGGLEQVVSSTVQAVSGFLLTAPTSTTAVSGLMYWGIQIPVAPTGTYSGVNTYTSIFSP